MFHLLLKDACISNTIDWECSSNLSLISISSYVVRGTKETGNMYLFSSKFLSIVL